MMYADWFVTALINFLVSIPVEVFGLVAVAIGLPFVRKYPETKKEFTQFPHELKWQLVRLPSWLLWWDNQYDGLLGDKRGYWNDQCIKKYEKTADHPWCMWLWAAIRNPSNYYSRNVACIDISKCDVKKVWGDDKVIEEPGNRCSQFLMATNRETGKNYYRMFISWALPFKEDRALMLDIGYKFKLSHANMSQESDDKDKLRSPVFSISPWKTLK